MLRKTNGTALSRPSRIVLVDDHDLAREGLRSLLERERDLAVVGEATTSREAIALCRRLKPDLVLMDVRLADGNGLTATRALREETDIGVLMVSMHEDPDYFFEALEAGAAGYVLKGASRTEVIGAVRRVLRGETLAQTVPHNEGVSLLRELHEAIKGDELCLYYQPIVECASGRMREVEALVRWRHPRHGLLAPDQFIPLAEHSSFIHDLSHWVLHSALRQRQAWSGAGLEIPVAVNLSMRNLQNARLADQVAGLLELSATAPCDLTVEVTESTMMADPDRSIHLLTGLRTIGVRVAMDDFGTGYASLAHLKHLPLDVLKIDRTFVSAMTADPRDTSIVRSTIDLGHSLGLIVIAEGVEDRGTWDLLVELGCDMAQGFYLSRPVPAPELRAWLHGSTDYPDMRGTAAA